MANYNRPTWRKFRRIVPRPIRLLIAAPFVVALVGAHSIRGLCNGFLYGVKEVKRLIDRGTDHE